MGMTARWTKSRRHLELAKEYRRHELANKAFAQGFLKSGNMQGAAEFATHAKNSRAQAVQQVKQARKSLPIGYRAAKRAGMEFKLGRQRLRRALRPKPRKL